MFCKKAKITVGYKGVGRRKGPLNTPVWHPLICVCALTLVLILML